MDINDFNLFFEVDGTTVLTKGDKNDDVTSWSRMVITAAGSHSKHACACMSFKECMQSWPGACKEVVTWQKIKLATLNITVNQCTISPMPFGKRQLKQMYPAYLESMQQNLTCTGNDGTFDTFHGEIDMSMPPMGHLQIVTDIQMDKDYLMGGTSKMNGAMTGEVDAGYTTVLGDKGSNSCPSGSMDFTESECSQLGALTYSALRAGYTGAGSYNRAGTWSTDPTGCNSRGSSYYFNRLTSSNPESHEFKLCKQASQMNIVTTYDYTETSTKVVAGGPSSEDLDWSKWGVECKNAPTPPGLDGPGPHAMVKLALDATKFKPGALHFFSQFMNTPASAHKKNKMVVV